MPRSGRRRSSDHPGEAEGWQAPEDCETEILKHLEFVAVVADHAGGALEAADRLKALKEETRLRSGRPFEAINCSLLRDTQDIQDLILPLGVMNDDCSAFRSCVHSSLVLL